MESSANIDLVREIAERLDDGRRVHLVSLARELNVDFMELWVAYQQLADQRGGNPVLDRARRRLAAVREQYARR